MSESIRLIYQQKDVDVDPSNHSDVTAYISNVILPDTLRNCGMSESTTPLTGNSSKSVDITYVTFSKNSNIKQSVDSLVKKAGMNNDIVVVSYGMHIQKTLSIIEIFKSTDAGKKLHQFNRLDSFVEVKPGRNELLDHKVNIPILITAFTIEDVKNLSGFTKQS